MAEQNKRGESAQPRRPKRVWNAVRKCWVEAMTVCRSGRGFFVNKEGTEPDSQLSLPFDKGKG